MKYCQIKKNDICKYECLTKWWCFDLRDDDEKETFVFLSGVSYHIDQILGNCTILPLADTQFDTVEQKQDNTKILQMKNPEQLFKMDATYTFYGQVS